MNFSPQHQIAASNDIHIFRREETAYPAYECPSHPFHGRAPPPSLGFVIIFSHSERRPIDVLSLKSPSRNFVPRPSKPSHHSCNLLTSNSPLHTVLLRLFLDYNIYARVGGVSVEELVGHSAVVQLLPARHDVEADSKNNLGWTPLRMAVMGGFDLPFRIEIVLLTTVELSLSLVMASIVSGRFR
jgi:hypothetical protein